MIEFEDVSALLMPAIPSGIAVALPVPVMAGHRLYDVFLTYSVDSVEQRVGRPRACLAVSCDEGRVVDVSDAFGVSAMSFEQTDLVPIPDFRELLIEARALYGRVREEALAGQTGEATRRYAELATRASQPCLLPWYRALGLGDKTDSQEREDS